MEPAQYRRAPSPYPPLPPPPHPNMALQGFNIYLESSNRYKSTIHKHYEYYIFTLVS